MTVSLADGDIIVQGTNFRPSGPDDKLFSIQEYKY